MRLDGPRRTVAFWAASSAIAFVMSFALRAVWLGERAPAPHAGALAYADGRP